MSDRTCYRFSSSPDVSRMEILAKVADGYHWLMMQAMGVTEQHDAVYAKGDVVRSCHPELPSDKPIRIGTVLHVCGVPAYVLLWDVSEDELTFSAAFILAPVADNTMEEVKTDDDQ